MSFKNQLIKILDKVISLRWVDNSWHLTISLISLLFSEFSFITSSVFTIMLLKGEDRGEGIDVVLMGFGVCYSYLTLFIMIGATYICQLRDMTFKKQYYSAIWANSIPVARLGYHVATGVTYKFLLAYCSYWGLINNFVTSSFTITYSLMGKRVSNGTDTITWMCLGLSIVSFFLNVAGFAKLNTMSFDSQDGSRVLLNLALLESEQERFDLHEMFPHLHYADSLESLRITTTLFQSKLRQNTIVLKKVYDIDDISEDVRTMRQELAVSFQEYKNQLMNKSSEYMEIEMI